MPEDGDPQDVEHCRPSRLEAAGRESVCTDEWQSSAALPLHGEHIAIRKERVLPKSCNHINGVEGLWELRPKLALPLPSCALAMLLPVSRRGHLPVQSSGLGTSTTAADEAAG